MLQLGLIPDFKEEKWPSMNLCAESLQAEIDAGRAGDVKAVNLLPPYTPYATRVPLFGRSGTARNADRFLNRMRFYPNALKKTAGNCDAYHVCDHAYSNVVHALLAERSGVFCHDLDTFRCLLNPELERRPGWFKKMMRSVLDGMQKAAVVFHTTDNVRAQILQHRLVDPAKLVKARLGVSAAYTAFESPSMTDLQILNSLPKCVDDRPYVMHVGSSIPRKRIDVLLDVFAGLRARNKELRLVQVGATWTDALMEQRRKLGIDNAIIHFPWLEQNQIACLYRHARAVLQPSEAEGFGLPVIEALACGAIVVASGIATLREVGGNAALYCPVAAVDEWVAAAGKVVENPASAPTHEERLKHAAKFTWTAHAKTVCDAYKGMVQ